MQKELTGNLHLYAEISSNTSWCVTYIASVTNKKKGCRHGGSKQYANKKSFPVSVFACSLVADNDSAELVFGRHSCLHVGPGLCGYIGQFLLPWGNYADCGPDQAYCYASPYSHSYHSPAGLCTADGYTSFVSNGYSQRIGISDTYSANAGDFQRRGATIWSALCERGHAGEVSG